MSAAKKKSAKKPAKKKAAAKKPAAKKKAAKKKAAAKKPAAKKAAAKKAEAKKPAAKKAAKKPAAKKATAKKPAAKKPTAKKPAAKKAAAAASGGFAPRSIAEIVEILRATRPDETLNAPDTHEHYDTIGTWSFDPVGQWASSPPFSVLYQQNNPLNYSKAVLDDPKTLVSYSNFGGAIATWNANGRGTWQHSPGAWILADIELVQEQAGDDDFFDEEGGGGGNYVSLIFALWKIAEGWAAAVWEPGDRDTLARLIGLPEWPSEGWQACEVWYGE
jgi:hypothetical protein